MNSTRQDTTRTGWVVAAIAAVFILHLASQVAVTPIGEGLDFYGHLAYTVFWAEEGRMPMQIDMAYPAWIERMDQLLPAPDHSQKGWKFRAWAAKPPAEKAAIRKEVLTPPVEQVYVKQNYQTHQPPFYYYFISHVYRVFPPAMRMDVRIYLLELVSILFAAIGIPAVYLTFRLWLNRPASLLGVLGMVWHPNLIPFLGRLANDTLTFGILAWAVYFAFLTRRSKSMGPPVIAGLLLGVACFTKAYVLSLAPLFFLLAFFHSSGLSFKRAVVMAASLAAFVGSFLLFNKLLTGHFVLVWHVSTADRIPLLKRILTIFQINPFWFLSGMTKGFWWSGDWSFISPGIIYYLPLIVVPFLFIQACRKSGRTGSYTAPLKQALPAMLAILFFMAGIAWHAISHRLASEMLGRKLVQGNEGWYLNVVAGCFYLVAAILASHAVSRERLVRVLGISALFLMIWNLVARLAIGAFWTGAVHIAGRLRGVVWTEAAPALLNPGDLANWFSVPGVILPLTLTAILPLAAAMALTLWIVLTVTRTERNEIPPTP